MPVWAELLGGAALILAFIFLLYAFALWWSVRDESFFSKVRDLAKQILSGDFF